MELRAWQVDVDQRDANAFTRGIASNACQAEQRAVGSGASRAVAAPETSLDVLHLNVEMDAN